MLASIDNIRGPSLDTTSIWFAVLNEWFHKPREFIESDSFPFFKAAIAKVYSFDLPDRNGGFVVIVVSRV